jgi:hypothetical protein
MRKKFLFALTAVTVLGVIVALTLAGSAPAITTATTLRLVEDPDHFRERVVDVAPIDQFNAGDGFLSRGRLLDAGGNDVGFDQISCTFHIPFFINEKTGEFRISQLCKGTFTLAEGTIELSGTVTFFGTEGGPARAAAPFNTAQGERGEGFHIAVTGGTGAYQNARGEVRVGREDEIVIRLIP